MGSQKKAQAIKITITAEAVIPLDGLEDIQIWIDSICEIGKIIDENVEVVEVE